MSDEREPLWSDTEIAEIIAGMASKWEAAILYSILRGKRDDYEARIAELEVALANVLATNRRNVEDAARIIKANQGGLELAHVSLGELGKRERRIVELEQKLATAQEHIAAQESIYQVALDSIEELEARLAQTWQPLPDGEYGNVMVARNGEVLSVLERDGLLDESFWSGRFIADNIRLCRLVERDEPQPDWSSAPEWAQWWSVDADGEATFWQNKPDVIYIRGMWYDDGECLVACDLDLPIGIDWRTTLRQRPTEDSHE